ncbi:methylase [Microbotryum lychnidis-dioicae p1A1 Lamole]|uniref:Methylase n=1 Tax=Microbotryum lychnidis-dioicae (strain p1A1 Lamole / MvSl-1064) TaxID=683840 RepID=U5H4V8_USTV1|nr:methylase [Microbotryum lychnidis-dioicae p1A1 Lamole]|eukprot:KDE07479.1 methylase [Microbotryum lychnidis-dioicae p1A1 Lamole]
MIPTPSTSHLSKLDFESVYEPAEDTFALLDALEADRARLQGSRLCLEIGSGSGVVSTFLGTLLAPNSTLLLTTDLSLPACLATHETPRLNSLRTPFEIVQTDLCMSLFHRLQHACDVIVFNPPYVPTSEDELEMARMEGVLERAWAGGADGMQVTDRLLDVVELLLSNRGLFYLVTIVQNKPQQIIEGLEKTGLRGEVVLKRRAGGEHLHILRFSRPDPTT